MAQVRAIFFPLGNYLAQFGDGQVTKAALDSVATARKAYWKVFWQQPEVAYEILTPTQRTLMPMLVSMSQVPAKEREDSQWFFGFPVGYRDREGRAVER